MVETNESYNHVVCEIKALIYGSGDDGLAVLVYNLHKVWQIFRISFVINEEEHWFSQELRA